MDIKLMNYGRGAGKTYTLKNWAMKNLNTRVLVTARHEEYIGTNIHRFRNVWGYDADPKQFLERISRGDGIEIAFDGFDLANIKHTQLLATVQVMGVKSVILATTHATMEPETPTRKVGSWEPTNLTKTSVGDKKIEGVVAEGIIKAAGDIGREFIRQHNEKYEPIKTGYKNNGIPLFEGIKYEKKDEPLNKDQWVNRSTGQIVWQPVQDIAVKDLHIGDWVVGKGHVMKLTASENQLGYVSIEVADHQDTGIATFRGTFPHVRGTSLITVDLSKRK